MGDTRVWMVGSAEVLSAVTSGVWVLGVVAVDSGGVFEVDCEVWSGDGCDDGGRLGSCGVVGRA